MSSHRPVHPAAAAAIAALLLLAVLSADAPAAAQRLADLPAGEAYSTCIRLARQKPEDGFEAAIAWRDEGGGPAAKHCTAVALVQLGQYGDAALRLETLADEMGAFTPAERAAVLGQAGRAWLRAEQPERAEAALSIAVDLAPDSADLRVDRGEIRAAAGALWDAVDDFNAALELRPDHLDALIFRGAAYRLLDAPELARSDLDAALARDPGNPDALVELGAVALEEGDRGVARRHWLRTIDLAPGSPAADAARRWLERLDVRVEDGPGR
ncbi:MAG: tetratricopeptide repeat protein [Alphaproteobacteria bacterium]